MPRRDLAGLRDQPDPEVVLQFLAEEAHLSIGVLGIVLHCGIIDSLGAVTQAGWHSEDLLASTPLILLLLLLRQRFVNLHLRRLYHLVCKPRILKPSIFLENGPAIILNEVLDDEISHYCHDILCIVIFELGQVVPILLLGHFEPLQIIPA